MKFLYEIYGQYNIASYPEPIRQLIDTHKAQCLRRHETLRKRKIVLCLPEDDRLKDYTNTVKLEDINPYYDHIIYMESSVEGEFPPQPLEPKEVEQYTAKSDLSKIMKAPKGNRIILDEKTFEAAIVCILEWFEPNEVYNLTTEIIS